MSETECVSADATLERELEEARAVLVEDTSKLPIWASTEKERQLANYVGIERARAETAEARLAAAEQEFQEMSGMLKAVNAKHALQSDRVAKALHWVDNLPPQATAATVRGHVRAALSASAEPKEEPCPTQVIDLFAALAESLKGNKP